MASTDLALVQPRRNRTYVATAAVLWLSVVACGRSESPSAADSRPLRDRLAALLGNASFAQPWYRSAAEASPATNFVVDGAQPLKISDAFVVGSVQSVRGVAAWSFAGGPQVEGGPNPVTPLAFNDPKADIDVVAITLLVERSSTADGAELPETISFGLSLPSVTSLPSLEKQLKSVGKLAVLLERNGLTPFDFDKSLYGVVRYGSFLGSVSGEMVTFGKLTPSAFAFATETVAVDAVIAGAGTIHLVTKDGQIERG